MKRQKMLALSLLAALSLAILQPLPASAATTAVTGGTNGPLCNSGGYFTPASVTVTAGDTVTFSVPANDPYAGGIQINGFPQGSFVVPRGGSVTTDALTANVSYQGTWPSALSCVKGSGTVTVQAAATPPPSTPAPAPTPTPNTTPSSPTSSSPTSTYSTKSYTKPSTTTTPTSTPSPATPTTQVAAPETVVADTITVAGKKVTSIQDLTIHESQPLVLSGTTVPNGRITLTIHSNPTTATVQADASGKWSYTVVGLQPGNHTVEAVVTDPATNQTSAQSKLLSFTIAADTAQPPASQTKKQSPAWFVSIAAGIFVLAVAAVLLLRMKGRGNTQMRQSPTSVPPAFPQTTMPQAGTQTPPTSVVNDSNERHKEDEL